MEDEKQTLRSQAKKLKRENQELREDFEDVDSRFKELRAKAQKQVDKEELRKMKEQAEKAWERQRELETDLAELRRKMKDQENEFKNEREKLEREKEEAVEKTYKTIVELKTDNEDELDKLREDLVGKDKIIKSLMEEMKKIKDYISKLEREIFDLSQEKEKLEENLKKVMHEWESEELKRYSSDKQINGKLKGKDEEIQELRDKLQQIDEYHQEAKSEIGRKADFYKKKSENLERSKQNLNKRIEKLEKTLKHKIEEREGRGSHVEIGSVGVRTMEDRGDLGRTKDTVTGERAEGDYEFERRQQIQQTLKMDGDLIKMIYTQANFIEDRLLAQSESEEEEEEEPEEPIYEHYAQGPAQMYVDNTQSSNPQQIFANANRVMVDENGDKYLIESEADDGDKLVGGYMNPEQFVSYSQMGRAVNPNQPIIQHVPNEARIPVNMVRHGGGVDQEEHSEGAEEDYEDNDDIIENEYSDMDNEEMYEDERIVQQENPVNNGHLVAGPVGGGMREEYERNEHGLELDYDEADEEDEGEFEEDDPHDDEENYHDEDFQMVQEQEEISENYQRKPALTFGIGKK